MSKIQPGEQLIVYVLLADSHGMLAALAVTCRTDVCNVESYEEPVTIWVYQVDLLYYANLSVVQLFSF